MNVVCYDKSVNYVKDNKMSFIIVRGEYIA